MKKRNLYYRGTPKMYGFGDTLKEKGFTALVTGPAGLGIDYLSKGRFSNWMNENAGIVGTVAGGAVGVAAGNPMMGAQIGGQVGGFVQQAEAEDDANRLMSNNINNFNKQSLAQQRISGIKNTESFKNGGSIHIKPENRGKFTAYKARTGKTTEEALHSKNPHVRQMANFARNARKWKHNDGGYLPIYPDGGTLPTVDSAYIYTANKYRPSFVQTQQYHDFDKADNGDLLSSRPLYDPNDKKMVIGTENYYKGVPGPQYLWNTSDPNNGATMEKYIIDGKTRFAGSEAPTFMCGGKTYGKGGNLDMFNYNKDVTYYANGGTHESNPFGGVKIGNKGLTEQGEVRYKNYIFSNRF